MSQMDGPKFTKKRKITDKSIPTSLLQNPDFASESRMYQDLVEMERKLDWTMMRKKAEVQDTLARNPSTTRTLRLFVSHTVSGQIWQTSENGPETVNIETGQGVPAWALKIEGRLLELPNVRSKDKQSLGKFSTFVKRLIVELDRDPMLYPDGNIVEWPKVGAPLPALDGFTIRRTGDVQTKIRIIMYMHHYPEQFTLKNELAQVLGLKEESRAGVIQALWNYIKMNDLQDKVERRFVHADEHLRPIFGSETVPFQTLPELVNRYLAPPEPVMLHYTLNPAVAPPERAKAWDVEIKMEDTALKGKMGTMIQANKDTTMELAKLDEEIANYAQSLQNAHLKRSFLDSFACDPAGFIERWLESQSRDLETVLGSGPSEGATVRAEDLRRSDFFRLPWVEEAVAVQEGMRMASKGMQ